MELYIYRYIEQYIISRVKTINVFLQRNIKTFYIYL